MSSWSEIEAVDSLIRTVIAHPLAKSWATSRLMDVEFLIGVDNKAVDMAIAESVAGLLASVDSPVAFTSYRAAAIGAVAAANCVERVAGGSEHLEQAVKLANASIWWGDSGEIVTAKTIAARALDALKTAVARLEPFGSDDGCLSSKV